MSEDAHESNMHTDDEVHKYYCTYCKLYVFGDGLALLAAKVNSHNLTTHPADFTNWKAENIAASTNYAGPAPAPPAYIKAYAERVNQEQDAKSAVKPLPKLTFADREFLKENRVIWDLETP